ncbi:hypothetical protein [Sphingomonas sp. OTU376]|uniref:hypothetical protein n=1 Tax=Sphingomonas sp. OTU376 TaxID=3043863 RepID=UPI00313D738A
MFTVLQQQKPTLARDCLQTALDAPFPGAKAPPRTLRIVAIWQRSMANRPRVIKLSRSRNGTVPNPA